MAAEYGDNYNKPLMIVISLVVLGAIAGAITLVRANTPDCRSADMTYCGHESGF
jgi:hypothetical protein